MIDFFKKIMPNFANKKTLNSNGDTIKLFLDRKRKTFIQIKIYADSTCQEIHSNYHSEIVSFMSQNLSQKKPNNLQEGYFPKNFNSKDFNFILIDEENHFLELKMKEFDFPMKFMTKPTINLFYLNTAKGLRKESFDNELNSYSINSIGKNRKNFDSQKRTINYDSNTNVIIEDNEESIREGDLMKFSNKKKYFENRKVIIDKNKMIIEKRSKNGKKYSKK